MRSRRDPGADRGQRTAIRGHRVRDRRASRRRRPAGLAQGLHEAASNAFFDGFQIAVLVAVAITLAGAVAAAILIPSQPPQTACEPIELSGPQVSPQRPYEPRHLGLGSLSRTSLVGSRRFSAGEVRMTAQCSVLASTVTAAPCCSPRISSHTHLGSQAVAVLARESPDPDQPLGRGGRVPVQPDLGAGHRRLAVNRLIDCGGSLACCIPQNVSSSIAGPEVSPGIRQPIPDLVAPLGRLALEYPRRLEAPEPIREPGWSDRVQAADEIREPARAG